MANDDKTKAAPFHYVMLTPQDRLTTARDFLRGRETDHYRLFLSTPETDPARDQRLAALAHEIDSLQAEVSRLETEVTPA